jgi:hypothetical protein
MKKPKIAKNSTITRQELIVGETIETKVNRIVHNGEPIKDGAPEIFTERKDGVLAAYDVRTDKWEIAAEAMDVAERSKMAKAKGVEKTKEATIEPTEGTNEGESKA